MKTFLKIKAISLAEEIHAIRREARKWHGRNPLKSNLLSHAKELAPEARAVNIAYGFLRGHTFSKIEQKCYFPPDWQRVAYHVEKFGGGWHKGQQIDVRDLLQKFSQWLDEAKAANTPVICIGRRQLRDEVGKLRRAKYHTAQGTFLDSDAQAKLKAALKEKWAARTTHTNE